MRSKNVTTTPSSSYIGLCARNDKLLTAHVNYGDSARECIPELKAIAKWMANWATQTSRYHQNLLLLGDFNIDHHGSEPSQAFTSTGLHEPEALRAVKRSIFIDRGEDPRTDKHYDQIAGVKTGASQPAYQTM
ncbi:hypothetical protein SAMN02745866_04263 [Alteromonadaceae bacterium Bs31]|nr:hypothetical protein SAMN02745866_04263 [Alteromonadaceae bacterium Bs31]